MLLSSATVRDLDRLTARVSDTPTGRSGAKLSAYRIDDGFYVDIDLPGAGPAGIDIAVDRGVLTIRAERETTGTSVTTPAAGPVSREVALAKSLDTDRLEARYADGVLSCSIPVTDRPQPRTAEAAV